MGKETFTDVLPEKRFPVNAVKDAKNSFFFKAVVMVIIRSKAARVTFSKNKSQEI